MNQVIALTWLSAFIDYRPEAFVSGTAFWSAVTGCTVSDPRGEYDEFVSLVPARGDNYLRIQRRREGASRMHLDLSVPAPRLAANRASSWGARELADNGDHIALVSPGGLVFCFVTHSGAERPEPAEWPGGHRSSVHQVCIDIPAETYAAESAFWRQTMGASLEVLGARPEFSWVRGERQLALDVLLQRLDTPTGIVGAHLDLGTDDRPAEVERHLALGAEEVTGERFWTVMCDPTGLVYCITDRDPKTGRLAAAQRSMVTR
jgi:Glyoxalase-like domain